MYAGPQDVAPASTPTACTVVGRTPAVRVVHAWTHADIAAWLDHLDLADLQPVFQGATRNAYARASRPCMNARALIARVSVRASTHMHAEHDILGDVLLALDNGMLKDMGVTSAGQRLRRVRALDDLRAGSPNPAR